MKILLVSFWKFILLIYKEFPVELCMILTAKQKVIEGLKKEF